MNDYSEATMHLRGVVLRILLSKFDDNKSIYECADDWCSKQVTSYGVVKYYEWINPEIENQEVISLEYIGKGSKYE